MNKKHKVIARFIAAPLVLGVLLISYITFAVWFTFKAWWNFLRNGGELIVYNRDDSPCIKDIYDILKSEREGK